MYLYNYFAKKKQLRWHVNNSLNVLPTEWLKTNYENVTCADTFIYMYIWFIPVNHTSMRVVQFYLRLFFHRPTIICLVVILPLVCIRTHPAMRQNNKIDIEKLVKCNIWSGTKSNRVNSWVGWITRVAGCAKWCGVRNGPLTKRLAWWNDEFDNDICMWMCVCCDVHTY